MYAAEACRVKMWWYNFCQKQNSGQKSKFWSKVKFFIKNPILHTNRNFGQKSKFWSEIEILKKNGNVGQKSNFG